MSAESSLGTVAVLRRYPVKSMLGEGLPDGEVTMAGLAGDRVRGLVHRETGKIASAKNPRLWRRLLTLHAACSGTAVTITFPDGAVLDDGDPGVEPALSEFLGQPARCAIPTLEHGGLPRDTDALRVPAAHNRISAMDGFAPQPCAGVYAQVIRPGLVRPGDAARLA